MVRQDGDTHVLGDRVAKVERDEVAGKGEKVSSGRVAEDAQGERDGPSNRSQTSREVLLLPHPPDSVQIGVVEEEERVAKKEDKALAKLIASKVKRDEPRTRKDVELPSITRNRLISLISQKDKKK